MYSFIVFKYVNLILWKENYILGRIGLYFWGESELILRIWEQRKIFSRSWGAFFQEVGEINALFSRIKGAQTPLGSHLKFYLKGGNKLDMY